MNYYVHVQLILQQWLYQVYKLSLIEFDHNQITQHIWQTLVDLIFFHQQNSTLIQLKQQDLTIGIDLITMTAFYQMIYNLLHLFNNQAKSFNNE